MNEFTLLATVATFTAIMWVPYVLDRIHRQGILDTVGYPEVHAQSPWAQRAIRAHANAVENLAVFTALLIVLYLQDGLGPDSLLAAQIFTSARIVHFLVYVGGIPWLRTAAFLAGFAAQMMLAANVLAT